MSSFVPATRLVAVIAGNGSEPWTTPVLGIEVVAVQYGDGEHDTVRRPLVMIPPGGVCSVQELEREAGYWIELVSEQCSAEQMMAARERVARAAGRPAKETKGTEL